MRFYFVILALVAPFWCTGAAVASDILHQWVQLGPGSEIVVRTISRSSECPSLKVDGQFIVMRRRAGAEDGFPGQVCEQRLNHPVGELVLDGAALPTLKQTIRRIAVIGDTGCRIRGSRAQACNDPDAWPLDTIMAEIAARKPDLVIHVGDYHYRSSPCPPGVDCAGSPYGDNFETWVADWLGPAQKLMAQVPFVFVRGNHENCGRGAKGWFRYFAAGPVPADCPAVTDPWKVLTDGLDLVIFDASAGRAPESPREYLSDYKRLADDMFANMRHETLFLTHRPLWVNMFAFGELIDGDDTQREAFGAAIPDTVSLILSGHIHAFQALDLADGPVQVITGNSGTRLDPMPTGEKRDFNVAGRLMRQIVNDSGFGFLMLTRVNDSAWQMDALDTKGSLKRRCQVTDRRMSCGAQ